MFFAIFTILGGLLAASALIIARNPSAERLFDRVRPYQVVIGLALLGFGVYHLVFRLLPNLSAITTMPLSMGLVIAGLTLDIAIGFLLGYDAIRARLRHRPGSTEKGDAAFARLLRIQVPMGIGAVAVGTLLLIGL